MNLCVTCDLSANTEPTETRQIKTKVVEFDHFKDKVETMTKNKILVQGSEINIFTVKDKDFISLTDIVRNIENRLVLIENWLRNKNTIEFLGIWEEIYNPNFNSPEFEGIKNQTGLNRFALSVNIWVKKPIRLE